MIKLIGKKNCSRCDMVKNILSNKNVDYEYFLLEELETDEKNNYLKMARESKQMEMPLIIKDNKIITVQEAI